jgi:hypothetical protein
VRFGIAGKTELRFATPDYSVNDDTASGLANGFGDLTVGFKQQLGPIRGGFDVSLTLREPSHGSEVDIKSWL